MGLVRLMLGFPSSLRFGVGGQSFSNLLASTVLSGSGVEINLAWNLKTTCVAVSTGSMDRVLPQGSSTCYLSLGVQSTQIHVGYVGLLY